MPSPEAGGRSRARPQNMPRSGLVTKALTAASCRLAFRPSLQAATMQRSPNISRSMFRCSGSSHRAGTGRIHRASPSGPDHAGCWPGERGRRSFVAVAAPQQTSVRQHARPSKKESLRELPERLMSMRSLPRGLEIDQEREETANGWKR